MDPRRYPCDLGPGLIEDAGPDQDRIGARAERHFDSAPCLLGRLDILGQRCVKTPQDGFDHRIVGAVERFDGEIGEGVGRGPLLEQPAQGLFRIGRLQERSVGLLAHAGEQNFETRLQPDRDAMSCDVLAGRRIHERAAAGREHQGPAIEQAGDHLALALTEIELAETLEDLGNGQLRAGFDFGVGVDERQSEPGRKPLPDRGFPGSHHTDENHRAAAERGRHPPGVDRLALTHELFHLAQSPVRAVPYRSRAANARLAGAVASRHHRLPSCAQRVFLQPCRPRDSAPAAVVRPAPSRKAWSYLRKSRPRGCVRVEGVDRLAMDARGVRQRSATLEGGRH